MIARVLVTAGATLLGLYALWDNVLGAGVFLGIMFFLVAGLIWFGWEPLREGFSSAKDESEIPISILERLGITIIRGMKTDERRRRTGSD
jgi:predicted membrane metal-binding protein